MAANTRTEHERERDLEIISDMYCRGYSQSAIAEKIGCVQQQVSYDLKVLHERWKASGIRNLDAAKERELRRLDALEQEAWDAWRRSQEEQRTTETEVKPGKSDEEKTTRAKVVKRTGYGDPRFLSVIEDCIARRSKILGIDAPREVRLTGKDGGPVEVKGEWDLKGLSTDELQQYRNLLTKLAGSGDSEGAATSRAGD